MATFNRYVVFMLPSIVALSIACKQQPLEKRIALDTGPAQPAQRPDAAIERPAVETKMPEVEVIARGGHGRGKGLVVENGQIYWATAKGFYVASDEGKQVKALQPIYDTIEKSFVFEGNALFWTTMARSEIHQLDLATNQHTTLKIVTNSCSKLVVDATHIYFVARERSNKPAALYRVSRPHGPAKKVASGAGCVLAGDMKDLYTAVGDQILVHNKNSGSFKRLASGVPARNIAVGSDALYVSAWRDEAPGRIVKISKQDGEVTDIANEQSMPGEIVADDAKVCWLNNHQENVTVRCASTDGTSMTDMATNQRHASGLTLANGSLYWIVDVDADFTTVRRVKQLPR